MTNDRMGTWTASPSKGFTPTMERHCVNSLSMKYMPGPLPADAEEEKVLPPFENPMEKAKGLLGELIGNK